MLLVEGNYTEIEGHLLLLYCLLERKYREGMRFLHWQLLDLSPLWDIPVSWPDGSSSPSGWWSDRVLSSQCQEFC